MLRILISPPKPVSYTHLDVYKRQQRGSRAYCANSRLLRSKLIGHNTKNENIYKGLIRPVVAYSGETLTLAETRRRFKRKVVRPVYGPVKEIMNTE